MQLCSKCQIWKEKTGFRKSNLVCKECQNIQRNQLRANNRKKYNHQQRVWARNNRDKISRIWKTWSTKNHAHINAYHARLRSRQRMELSSDYLYDTCYKMYGLIRQNVPEDLLSMVRERIKAYRLIKLVNERMKADEKKIGLG